MADLIDHMTSRFLQWKLPDDFSPDGGVTFTAVSPHGPVGTNLLTYAQAKAMVEYMIDGAPIAALTLPDDEAVGEVLERLQKTDEYEPLGHTGWEAADLITTLLAQRAADAARIRELKAERDRRTEMHECAMSERDDATLYADEQKARAESAEATVATLTAQVEAMRGALTPSADTKADYIGEFSFPYCTGFDADGNEVVTQISVPWTTIKEIMAAIRARAALTTGNDNG